MTTPKRYQKSEFQTLKDTTSTPTILHDKNPPPPLFIDDVEKILTVHFDKYVDFDSVVYKMSSDTYEELVTLCERFEESLMETGNIRSEVESENSETEMDNDI